METATRTISGATEITMTNKTSNGDDEKAAPKVGLSVAAAAAEELKSIKRAHQWDPNLPAEKVEMIDKALQDGQTEEIIAVDELFTENSPYEEVRAAVRNTDGGEVANTVRAWILGMIFVTVGSGLNMFLSMR
ncbi:hypothetical protein VTK73DRAFT_1128 [Phialemonium thermophilum]|uniref:Uncharacterized protein n=1 Tax=Phialemonium thermophilum TaxID=223376 RepID=A0ABR3VTW9_9PEZI